MISPRDQKQFDYPEDTATFFVRTPSADRPGSEPAAPATPPPEQPHGETPPPSPKPPRGAKWRTLLLVLVGTAVVFAVGTFWGKALVSGTRRMWQAVTGVEDDGVAAESHTPGDTPDQFWTCGMHPWVILPEPGLCPICHMELTPLDPAKLTGEIAIDPVVVQNIGVRVAPVRTGPLQKDIRTVGSVAYDESAVRDVNTKIPGWIEKLYVDETGAVVEQGAPLFELYSPELYQAQQEYLLALKGRSSLSRGLLDDARTKLDFFDISPQQIRELEQRGTVKKTLTITSPHRGVVVDKNAQEGMKIEPGTRVYRIADLSRIWVIATFYEYQLPYIKVGQPAAMTLPYLPGETFEGEVVYIYPYLQEESRQVKVRLEFENPNRELKPGMFANVQLVSKLDEEAVLAPREAIIATGKRQVAFVSLGEGKFEPRDVDTGVETENGLVEILDGLKPGETVVTSGQFLLDSESKMRAALAKMVKGELAAEQTGATEVAEATALAELPQAVAERLNGIIAAYTAIGDQLVANTTEGIEAPARRIVSGVDGLVETPLPDKPDYWKKSLEAAAVRGKASELAEVKNLAAGRALYASLSQALAGLLEETGVPHSYGEGIEALTCPMYPPKQGGAVWLQPAGPARNPYMGQGPMLRCVGERELLPVAGPSEQQMNAVVSADVQQQVLQFTRAYLNLQQMLFRNTARGSEEALEAIRQAALELAESRDEALRSRAAEVADAAVRQPEDLAKLRAAFKSLSAAVIELVRQVPPGTALREVYCPMAKASWLQTESKVQNPYYGRGSEMADCGTIKGVIERRPIQQD